jgi:hypothetical protein
MTLALQIPITDPVLLFGVVLALVLIAPLFAEKLRLPGLVGLILAGILFGPYGMGLLELEAEIRLLGQIGIVYIVFCGLEIDLAQFSCFAIKTGIRLFHFCHSLSMGILLACRCWDVDASGVFLHRCFPPHAAHMGPGQFTWTDRYPAVIASVGGTFLGYDGAAAAGFRCQSAAGQMDALLY